MEACPVEPWWQFSQAHAALTTTAFLVSEMKFHAGRLSAGSSESHQRGAWVSSRARKNSFPSREFLWRKRSKKLWANVEFAFERTGLTLPFRCTDREKASNGLVTPGDDDLFTGIGLFDEARQVGLGLVDGNDGHVALLSYASLAKLSIDWR